MTESQFEALCTLISNMHMHLSEMHVHPNDRPRTAAIQRELQDAIDEARSSLVEKENGQ